MVASCESPLLDLVKGYKNNDDGNDEKDFEKDKADNSLSKSAILTMF